MMDKSMTHHECTQCKSPLTNKINGRTLSAFIEKTKATHKRGKIPLTKWVEICPSCDAYMLGAELTHPAPFLCEDGVMRTVKDFDFTKKEFKNSFVYDFCNFNFTKSAFESGVFILYEEDSTTKIVEEFGGKILDGSSTSYLDFSVQVCDWGRGQRVLGNLKRHHKEKLEGVLRAWLTLPNLIDNHEMAIKTGAKIKGLGVSFASKHLRMLAPEHHAVLDDVLSQGLGFALNEKGYVLFIRMLNEFKKRHHLDFNDHNLAEIEAGIFLLVRQHVRSPEVS
jgi:hypothetical protein